MQILGQKYQVLPWTIVTAGAAILAYKLSGKGLALFAGLVMIYISIFGQWKPSMQTLSFILVAAPLIFYFWFRTGHVAAYKSKGVEKSFIPNTFSYADYASICCTSTRNCSFWSW